MAKKLYDLAVKTGSYTDREGAEKGRWQNIGAVMQGDDGNAFLMLAAWFNPAGVPRKDGSESILVSCFKPEPKDGQQTQSRSPAPRSHGDRPGGPKARTQTGTGFDDMDSDIPF